MCLDSFATTSSYKGSHLILDRTTNHARFPNFSKPKLRQLAIYKTTKKTEIMDGNHYKMRKNNYEFRISVRWGIYYKCLFSYAYQSKHNKIEGSMHTIIDLSLNMYFTIQKKKKLTSLLIMLFTL